MICSGDKLYNLLLPLHLNVGIFVSGNKLECHKAKWSAISLSYGLSHLWPQAKIEAAMRMPSIFFLAVQWLGRFTSQS